jgi:DNA polymerase (family X)
MPPWRPFDKVDSVRLTRLDNRHVTILAHPTGRLLRAARLRGCFLKINAYPDRLDLSDLHRRMVKNEGIKLSLGSDAHCVRDLAI